MDRSKKAYVGNLPCGVTEDALSDFFTSYGPVTEIFIARDFDGKDKGFGFVTFENEEDMNKAIEATNGEFFQGRRIAVRKPLPFGQKSEFKEKGELM